MNFQISKRENQIISKLISDNIISSEKIEYISKEYLENLEKGKKSLFKKFYFFDDEKSLISVKDFDNNLVSQIKLGKETKISNSDFRNWAESTIVLNEENKKTGDFFTSDSTKNIIAFLSKNNSACLFDENIYKSKYIPQLKSYISNVTDISKNNISIFDLFFSNDYLFMTVVNRSTGEIYLIDIDKDKLIKSFNVKTNQSLKVINISIASKNRKMYITDNASTSISVFNFDDNENILINPSIGILGSNVLSFDEKNLYILATKPKPILKIFNLETNSVKKEFTLKGNLFSSTDSPYDLLTSSVDNKFIYLMTYIPDPEPFTPVITVIDSETEKAVLRFSIKDGIKISNLAIGFLNDLHLNKNIIDLILDKNILNKESIKEFEKKVDSEENEQNILESLDINTDPTIMEIQPGRKILIQNENSKEEKKEEVLWKINQEPQKIEFCNITPGLDGILSKKCIDKVLSDYQLSLRALAEKENWEKVQTEIDKRYRILDKKIRDKDSIISIRLNDSIVKVRQELEWHDLAIIRLIELLDDYNFEMSFNRVDCLEWLREKERDELIETGLKTIATNCPNCNAQLLGSYTCRACGFELEKPEDMIRRKLFQVSTYHPMENLQQGHLIITDIVNHKVIETDHFRRITYELKKDVLHSELEVELEIPRDAVRLKNNITLVVDYGSNRVIKLTQRGRKYWELNYEMSKDHELNKPISASALESGNTVIVDYGNHRIIEVTEDHEIEWNYGEKGVAGISDGQLNYPTFFQRTKSATNIITDSQNHRIIELEGKKIIWQYGNENNITDESAKGNAFNQLDTPLTAWRYENGNTLILDSGNKRVIEVTKDKSINWEYSIDTDEKPVKAFRLKTGKVIIITEKNILEIDYNTKEVSWSSSITELTSTASKSDINTVSDNHKKTKVFHGVSNRYVSQAFVSDSKKDDEKIKSYVESKRAGISVNASEKSSVILTAGAEVIDTSLSSIDKIKSLAYIIDRKGNTIWKYGENSELKKPQYISDNENNIVVADTDNKRILVFEKSNSNFLKIINKEDLTYIKSVELTKNNSILTSDSLGGKVSEIDFEGNILNQIKDGNLFKNPYHCIKLDNQNILITDWGNHQVIELNQDKQIVWSYGNKVSGSDKNQLSYPEYSQRLDNGDTLITDSKNSRIIQVNVSGNIVWEYIGQGIHKLMNPTRALRLENKDTIIYHSNNRQIIEIDENGKILWKYLHK